MIIAPAVLRSWFFLTSLSLSLFLSLSLSLVRGRRRRVHRRRLRRHRQLRLLRGVADAVADDGDAVGVTAPDAGSDAVPELPADAVS